MQYDKNSFLAGIAVGRNLKQWPILNGDDDEFRFTVYGTRDYSTPGMVFNGVISWGDGTETVVSRTMPSDYDPANRVSYNHRYGSVGNYQITLVGDLRDWSIGIVTSQGVVSRGQVISVDTPFPRTMGGRMVFDYTFSDQGTMLTSICPRVFKNCKSAQSMRGLAQDADGLSAVPADLFVGCKNVTDMSFVFAGAGLSALPDSLFVFCPKVETLYGAFTECPIEGELPQNLFNRLTELTDVSFAFQYCRRITSIQSGLFSACPITEFSRTFRYCTGITGAVPALWEEFPDANGAMCFRDCYNASNYADIPLDWR